MKKFSSFCLALLVGVSIGTITTQAATPVLRIASVTSTPANGSFYQTGETVNFRLNFSQTTRVTGAPTVNVSVAGNTYSANYASGSGTKNLVFGLTVANGMNDANGISLTGFDFGSGRLSDVATGDVLVVNDFTDISLAAHLDADLPNVARYSVSSTDGVLSGGTRYLQEDDSIVVRVNLNQADTRGATSVDLDIGGTALNLAFSGTATAGTSTSYQRTSPANFLNGQNGALTLAALNYTDNAGRAPASVPTAADPNIVVDSTAPIITFTDDIAPDQVTSDTINIAVTETNSDTNTYQYGFSPDNVCNASDSFTQNYISGSNITFNTEANNGSYACVRATDLAGNTSYLSSANPLNIDVTPPTVTGTIATSSNANPAWAKAGDTITYTINFSESVTLQSVNNASSASNASTLTTEVDVSDATSDTLVFTVTNGENGTISPTVNFSIRDTAGNTRQITSLGTIAQNITADTNNPSATNLSIASKNSNTAWATNGNEITLSLNTNETVQTSSVSGTILAENASVTKGCTTTDCANYSLTLTTSGNEIEGVAPIDVSFADLAGNSTTLTSTTDSSTVTFDQTAPTVSNVSISSNNALDTSLAKTNDTITVEFDITDNLSNRVSLDRTHILNNSVNHSVTTVGTNHTMSRFTDGSETTETVVPFRFRVNDLAGNHASIATATTDGSSVRFDRTDPSVRNVAIAATSQDNSADLRDAPTYYAKQGDGVTLTFEVCDYVDSQNNPPTGTILGASPTFSTTGLTTTDCTTPDGTTSKWRGWQAILSNANGTEGTVPFSITVNDNAGNQLAAFTSTNNSSKVIFDKTAPTLPTDVVDNEGASTTDRYKHHTSAVYSWSNDTDPNPNGADSVSGVYQYDIHRFSNTAVPSNLSQTGILAPTKFYNPQPIVPELDQPYELYLSIHDKAGNNTVSSTPNYSQTYGLGITGNVNVPGTIVNVIAKADEFCQPNQIVCSSTVGDNGSYQIVVKPEQTYIIDFINVHNYYLAKKQVQVEKVDVSVDVDLQLVTYPEIQTANQDIKITTDRIINAETSGGRHFDTEIWVSSRSGQITTSEAGGIITIQSFGEITNVWSNVADVVITKVDSDTYTVSNAGNIRFVHNAGTNAEFVDIEFDSKADRGGVFYLTGEGGSFSTNGISREEKYESKTESMTYAESRKLAEKMNEGIEGNVKTRINRNGHVVFAGYESGTLPLSTYKRMDTSKRLMYRGSRRDSSNQANQEKFKNLQTKFAKRSVTPKTEKKPVGIGRKSDVYHTEKTRRIYKSVKRVNPYAVPTPDRTVTKSRIEDRSNMIIGLRTSKGTVKYQAESGR